MNSGSHPSTEISRSDAAGEYASPSTHFPPSKDVSARILKKRESDRRCQRIKRERTKSKIAALEEKVKTFGDQDASGQVQLLMNQLHEVEKERDDLVKKVKIIESVIRDGDTEEGGHIKGNSAKDHSASTYASPSTADSPEHEHPDMGPQSHVYRCKVEAFHTDLTNDVETPVQTEQMNAQYTVPAVATDPIGDDEPHGPYVAQAVPSFDFNGYPQNQQPGETCECGTVQSRSGDSPNFNTWRFTNQVLSSRFQWPGYLRTLRDDYQDDVPVRVVVEGWDAVGAQGPMHPSWEILEKIDKVLFSQTAPKERLAVMYAVHLLLMSHTKPEPVPALPSFYRNRPSQNMADSYAIHFFPWPGMRERMVFNQHRYCTNSFWKAFIGGLRIVWPFEFRDCYTRNVETGLYSISPLFQERVNDIKCWAMESDVFQKWPELAADIPVYNSIPRAVSNVVSIPRGRKVVPSRAQHAGCHSQNGVAQAPTPRRSSMQPPIQSEPSSASYYQQPTIYNVNDKATPIMNWAQNISQQTQENFTYFAGLTNPVDVTTDF